MRSLPQTRLPLPPSPPRPAARRRAITRALGFTLSQDDSAPRGDRTAGALLRDASSLLVLQPVLNSAPALAFLNVLAALRDRRGELRAHGALFTALLERGESWTDHLAESLLSSETPFSAAAASAKPPSAALLAAAAADLAALQRLCVSEQTLAGWVETASQEGLSGDGLPTAWLKAASHSSAPNSDAESDDDDDYELEEALSLPLSESTLPPLAPPLRAALKRRLVKRSDWSLNVADLIRYHERYGVGAVSESTELAWSGGKLVARAPLLPLSFEGEACAEQCVSWLTQLLSAHARGEGEDRSALLSGEGRAGFDALNRARSILGSATAEKGSEEGEESSASADGTALRWVRLQRNDLRAQLAPLLAVLGKPQHARSRFVVLVDPVLELSSYSETHFELLRILQNSRRFFDSDSGNSLLPESCIPDNTVLLMLSAKTSGLREGSGGGDAPGSIAAFVDTGFEL